MTPIYCYRGWNIQWIDTHFYRLTHSYKDQMFLSNLSKAIAWIDYNS